MVPATADWAWAPCLKQHSINILLTFLGHPVSIWTPYIYIYSYIMAVLYRHMWWYSTSLTEGMKNLKVANKYLLNDILQNAEIDSGVEEQDHWWIYHWQHQFVDCWMIPVNNWLKPCWMAFVEGPSIDIFNLFILRALVALCDKTNSTWLLNILAISIYLLIM